MNEALSALEHEFAALYSPIGRPSIPPEKLLRAMQLQAFYSIRSERLLMERLEYDLLFRWFVGIGVDDAAWDHLVFSKNRDRLLEGDIGAKFLAAVLAQPKMDTETVWDSGFDLVEELTELCGTVAGITFSRALPVATSSAAKRVVP